MAYFSYQPVNPATGQPRPTPQPAATPYSYGADYGRAPGGPGSGFDERTGTVVGGTSPQPTAPRSGVTGTTPVGGSGTQGGFGTAQSPWSNPGGNVGVQPTAPPQGYSGTGGLNYGGGSTPGGYDVTTMAMGEEGGNGSRPVTQTPGQKAQHPFAGNSGGGSQAPQKTTSQKPQQGAKPVQTQQQPARPANRADMTGNQRNAANRAAANQRAGENRANANAQGAANRMAANELRSDQRQAAIQRQQANIAAKNARQQPPPPPAGFGGSDARPVRPPFLPPGTNIFPPQFPGTIGGGPGTPPQIAPPGLGFTPLPSTDTQPGGPSVLPPRPMDGQPGGPSGTLPPPQLSIPRGAEVVGSWPQPGPSIGGPAQIVPPMVGGPATFYPYPGPAIGGPAQLAGQDSPFAMALKNALGG